MTHTTRRISSHATSLYPAVALALPAAFWIAGPGLRFLRRRDPRDTRPPGRFDPPQARLGPRLADPSREDS